ncbi:MobF family relaxase [Nocardia sp. CY41]|uniref:MobF family relaxase n=1 Tax=Nocardia sp. CY41 TaxID=2608686 RepID=UPI001F33FDCE|nr:MobF family relaxase [Nocardia sp. CY41]
MSPHRLSADAGVDYYTRCVAVHDGHERGRASLSDYYSDRGEVPGIWLGSGLVAFDDIAAGDPVDEKQMAALYREGRHPNAEAIIAARLAAGDFAAAARKATQLGRPFYRFKVPEGSFRHRVAEALTAWNVAAGQAEDAPVPKDVREEIRTRIGREMFTQEHGREPRDGPELTDWMARHSRPERRAVTGFDLTFSAAKSVSAVWALAPREIAEKIEAAHAAAIADAFSCLERHGCYTRLGTDGVRQVDTEGMIATAFLHRDSRAGDPNLHTHVVVSNKVRTLAGRWRALDGRMVYQHAVTASEIYNARLEQHLGDAIGVRFTDRPARDASKRPVREIAGVAGELIELWSQRSTSIRAELATLTRQFQAKHGRAPIPAEVWKLAQQATIATRARKHEPRPWPSSAPPGSTKRSSCSVPALRSRSCSPTPSHPAAWSCRRLMRRGSSRPRAASSTPSPPTAPPGSSTTFAPRPSGSCAARSAPGSGRRWRSGSSRSRWPSRVRSRAVSRIRCPRSGCCAAVTAPGRDGDTVIVHFMDRLARKRRSPPPPGCSAAPGWRERRRGRRRQRRR